jgi:hypothetical protein
MSKPFKGITFSPSRFAIGEELWGVRAQDGQHAAYLVGKVARVTSAAVTFDDGTMRGNADSTPSFQTREQAEEWLKARHAS